MEFLLAGVAVINQYIYVIGGYDGSKQLSSVERYDTDKNVWEFVSSMKIARSALSVTVLDCKIYAMGMKLNLKIRTRYYSLYIFYKTLFLGGYDGQNFLPNVEVYDPQRDVWEDGQMLTSGRSGHASAACYQPPCLQNCQVMVHTTNAPTSSSRS